MLFVSVMFYVLFSLTFWYVYFLSVFSLVSAYNICYDDKKNVGTAFRDPAFLSRY